MNDLRAWAENKQNGGVVSGEDFEGIGHLFHHAIQRATTIAFRGSPLLDGLPWLSYAAIKWLDAHLSKDMTAYEWGAGGSTIFLSNRVKKVYSVEHDPIWFGRVEAELCLRRIDNCRLVLIEPVKGESGVRYRSKEAGYDDVSFESYVKDIDHITNVSLDLVLVDGRARVDCARRSLRKLKPGGYLMLDDSDRWWYRALRKELHAPETIIVDYCRYKDEKTETAVWRIPG